MLKQALKEVMEDRGFSLGKLSTALAISTSALSQWLNDSYGGNVEKIETKVKGFLEHEREKLSVKKRNFKFCMTTTSKRIFEIARLCHIKCKPGVAYGNSGIGKTTAAKEYVRKYPATILIEGDQTCSLKTILSTLNRKLGFSGIGSTNSLFMECVEKLKDSDRLIIIDEAEYLTPRVLDQLRRIYDQANIGILFIGMPRLIHNIRKLRGPYEQIFNRSIGFVAQLDIPKLSDFEALLEMVGESKELAKQYYDSSQANTRIFETLYDRCYDMAVINDRTIDGALIKSVANKMMLMQ
jgi:hypothetical protein